MKKRLLLSAGLILLLFVSCSVDEDMNLQNEIELVSNTAQNSNSSSVPIPDIVQNQMVVAFNNPLLTVGGKDTIRNTIQNTYNFVIQNTEVCDCDPNGPELWTIDTSHPDFIGVEELVGGIGLEGVGSLGNNTEEAEVEVDLQFYFTISNTPLSGLYPSSLNAKVRTNSSEDIINIAVLDTGIDYSYFPGQFLYNTSATDNGVSDISGYDFVNHDKDILDDHGHGTLVAKVITSQLDSPVNPIPYSILAVKAFDRNGTATYFDVVCGMNYISKLPDIHVINMSFGWYTLNKQSIFKNLIKSVEDTTLVITSAGNLGVNTDDPENAHFPSGYNYDLNNMITVGGYNLVSNSSASHPQNVNDILDNIIIRDSNYGVENIEVVAPYDGYDFLWNSQPVNLTGTSFSAAYATARAAGLYDRGFSVLDLKDAVINSTYYKESIEDSIKDGQVLVRGYINP